MISLHVGMLLDKGGSNPRPKITSQTHIWLSHQSRPTQQPDHSSQGELQRASDRKFLPVNSGDPGQSVRVRKLITHYALYTCHNVLFCLKVWLIFFPYADNEGGDKRPYPRSLTCAVWCAQITSSHFQNHLSQRMTKPTKRHVHPGQTGQPGLPPSLIRVFAVRMKKAWVLSYPGWSESSLGAHAILLVLSRAGSIFLYSTEISKIKYRPSLQEWWWLWYWFGVWRLSTLFRSYQDNEFPHSHELNSVS